MRPPETSVTGACPIQKYVFVTRILKGHGVDSILDFLVLRSYVYTSAVPEQRKRRYIWYSPSEGGHWISYLFSPNYLLWSNFYLWYTSLRLWWMLQIKLPHKLFWTELCSSPSSDVEVLSPSTSKFDYTWR